MNNSHYVGVDLGGTKILTAVVDAQFEIKARSKKKTEAHAGADAIVDRITKSVKSALEKAGVELQQLAAVGVTVPGQIDFEQGVVINTPNLGMTDVPLKAILEKLLGAPVILENDVNAGIYGEFVAGAARGYRHIVGMFPGTGVGGGLILNGQLYRGASGNAGEIGHMIVREGGALCSCGQRGCLESKVSRTAMAKEAAMLAGTGKAPTLLAAYGTDYKNYRSRSFRDAYENNERAVIRVVEDAARMMGVGLANCVNIFNPELIVLGGGVVEKLGSRYVEIAAESMRRHCLPALAQDVKVVAAALDDDAVFIGAAALAREATQ